LAALVELGARDALDAAAQAVCAIALSAPQVGPVLLEVAGAVLPRDRLDVLVLERAVAAGAQFVPGAAVERLTFESGRFTAGVSPPRRGSLGRRDRAGDRRGGGPRRLAGLERRSRRRLRRCAGTACPDGAVADEL
jgi:hypothetical protein